MEHTGKPCFPSISALGLALGLVWGAALPVRSEEPFAWHPTHISYKVEYDNKYRDLGKFLMLKQAIRKGETGWKVAKVDIPDSWSVEKMYFEGEKLVIHLSEYDRFYLSPRNWRALNEELRNLRPRDDEKVQAIWEEYGRLPT